MSEFILNSNEHKINYNTLRFNFKKPIRFTNSNISLTSMIFYNYFPNIDENYKIYVIIIIKLQLLILVKEHITLMI